MALTRRAFLVTTATVAAATTLPGLASFSEQPVERELTAWVDGDPYLCSVIEGGLGGREFGETRDRAMRFRTSAEDRDRHVLGLEMPHA